MEDKRITAEEILAEIDVDVKQMAQKVADAIKTSSPSSHHSIRRKKSVKGDTIARAIPKRGFRKIKIAIRLVTDIISTKKMQMAEKPKTYRVFQSISLNTLTGFKASLSCISGITPSDLGDYEDCPKAFTKGIF